MQVLLILITLKLVSCTQYYFDVNELHEPLTNYDIVSKTTKYCIYMNNKTLDNSYLTGTWYIISKFSKGPPSLDTEYCKTHNFTRPTNEELDGYKAKYDLQNETFVFDKDAVISTTSQGAERILKGILVGDKTAKYYFLDPKNSQRLLGMYEVRAFKPVNHDYLIHYDCSMRGHEKYLWSRRRNQTDEELESVIKPLYELNGYRRQRYCMKRKVVSTTPYF